MSAPNANAPAFSDQVKLKVGLSLPKPGSATPSLRAQGHHGVRPSGVGTETPGGWTLREPGCMEHRPPFGSTRATREEAQSLAPISAIASSIQTSHSGTNS